jgi:osmotically-inducible protein OsmY
MPATPSVSSPPFHGRFTPGATTCMQRWEESVMDTMERYGGGSSIELWLAEREDPGLDSELRRLVFEELQWEPILDPTEIEVEVNERAVTLRGVVRSYTEKVAARDAATRVPRVQAVTNDIRVELPERHVVSDAALQEGAGNVLRWDALVPDEHLRISVHDGIVTLEGWVEWDWQREAAELAVRVLVGVRGLENRIGVRPKWTTSELQPAVTAALRHHRELHARHVTVEARNGVVRLRGRVPSLAERSILEHAAWNVPGVTGVVDELTIDR